jgi:threonine dehydrogenase-like Zn-dependent dehydrogenase
VDLPRAIGLAERGAVDLASLVGERHPLEDWQAAADALLERRTLKVVVEP